MLSTTSELIESNHLAKFKINIITLKYSDQTCNLLRRAKYQDEIDFLVRNESRNRFIRNLCISLEGNTLVLFNFVDKHGKVLYNMINDENTKTAFYVHGGVDGEFVIYIT